MAVVAIGIDVFERVGNYSIVRQLFIHRTAVATMALRTTVLTTMQHVPFALIEYWVIFFMTGDT